MGSSVIVNNNVLVSIPEPRRYCEDVSSWDLERVCLRATFPYWGATGQNHPKDNADGDHLRDQCQARGQQSFLYVDAPYWILRFYEGFPEWGRLPRSIKKRRQFVSFSWDFVKLVHMLRDYKTDLNKEYNTLITGFSPSGSSGAGNIERVISECLILAFGLQGWNTIWKPTWTDFMSSIFEQDV